MHRLSLFPALQVRNYRIFWMTQWIALIGFWLQLTAQQGLLSAQLTQVADRFDEIQGIINLYQALGGGRE